MSRLFELWDSLARSCMGIQPVAPDCILELAPRRYFGRPTTLSDGTVLQRGVPVAEIHLNNKRLKQIEQEHGGLTAGAVMAMRREVESALYLTARVIAASPRWQDAQALWGLTLMHRGIKGLGFEVYDLPPTLFNRFTGFYLRQVMAGFHPQGEDRLHRRRAMLEPKMLVMPRSVLLNRYGQAAAAVPSPAATPS